MAIYRFCGLNVDMKPRYPLLTRRSAAYLTEGRAEPDVVIPPAGGDGTDGRAETNEYLLAGGLFYRYLLRFDGMMLHASAVGYGGRAYLFSAPEGTGKSTHTAGWRELLGDDAVIINDDKPALRFVDGRLLACGTPFSGSSPLNANLMLPVGGICFLERGEKNEISRVSTSEAAALLYGGTIRALGEESGRLLLDTLMRVAEQAVFYKLRCRLGAEGVRLSFETMTGGKA